LIKRWACFVLSLPVFAFAGDEGSNVEQENAKKTGFVSLRELRDKRDEEQNWGIAAAVRVASIPYSTSSAVADSTVSTFVPMMFYQGDRFFVYGTEGGLNLYREDEWEVNALIRMHFIDLPSSFQNEIGGDSGDGGLQFKFNIDETIYSKVDLMFDSSMRFHSVATIGARYDEGNWLVQPSASLIWKESDYNSYYYGLNHESIDGGIDLRLGTTARYHVASNLYLLGGAYARRFDNNVRDSATIDADWQGELYAGFGFFRDDSKPAKSSISNKSYWRIAHGWATPSNIGDIFKFNREKDEFDNKLTSIFYGHPLTDELFGLPLDIYLTPGVAWHWESDVQSSSQEYVLAIKAYYTFNWPVQWRFGLAEGLSYASQITYIEGSEMERKGYEPSKLLNYLDFSFDVNLGDIFNQKSLDDVWVGYSLHHRSAIFESASQFGRIKGGSNYNTVYVQFGF